jgi:hypothetical protein
MAINAPAQLLGSTDVMPTYNRARTLGGSARALIGSEGQLSGPSTTGGASGPSGRAGSPNDPGAEGASGPNDPSRRRGQRRNRW